MIAPMRIWGWSIRSIASHLGRAPSTISRELRRNHDGTGSYSGYWAHRDVQRRRRAVRRSCLTSGELVTDVQEKLRCPWSPEQIAHRVRLEYPHTTQMRISHQTIYTMSSTVLKPGRFESSISGFVIFPPNKRLWSWSWPF